jgi:arylsulfatase A-like enzyme
VLQRKQKDMEKEPLLEKEISISNEKSLLKSSLKIGAVLLAAGIAAFTFNQSQTSVETSLDAEQPSTTSTTAPHVVFMLIDDMGLNDIGYLSTDLSAMTPTLDTLAKGGIILEKYYSMQLCTPARSAFLTAKLPIKLGMQYENIHPSMPWGLPANEKIAPQYFRKAGYKCYVVGKWNQGHHANEFMPTSRGFDSFVGYLSDEINYYTHEYPQDYAGVAYQDFSEGTEVDGLKPLDLAGTYSTVIYTDRIKTLVSNHDSTTGVYAYHPMFLYYAAQSVHGPLDAPPLSELSPDALVNLGNLNYEDGEHRRVFAAIVSAFDSSVATIQSAMEEANMWSNTLLVVASDNGGCSSEGGSNSPLRGGKHWLFEGGVQVPAFVYSANTMLIPDSVAGTSYKELFHVTDWLPTIFTAVDLDASARPTAVNDIDGVDHWSMMTAGAGATSPVRGDILLHLTSWTTCCADANGDTQCTGFLSDCAESTSAVLTFMDKPRGAIISSNGYKLILNEYEIPWYGIPTADSGGDSAPVVDGDATTNTWRPDGDPNPAEDPPPDAAPPADGVVAPRPDGDAPTDVVPPRPDVDVSMNVADADSESDSGSDSESDSESDSSGDDDTISVVRSKDADGNPMANCGSNPGNSPTYWLFNLKDDPTETTNLYGTLPDIEKELMGKFMEYLKKEVQSGWVNEDSSAAVAWAANGDFITSWL